MTVLRIALALAASLVLHAALASVLIDRTGTPEPGIDAKANAVTLVLIESPSKLETEAAPSPAPGNPAEEAPETAELQETSTPVPAGHIALPPPLEIVPLRSEMVEAAISRQSPEAVSETIAEPMSEAPEPLDAAPVDLEAQPEIAEFEPLPETIALLPTPRPTFEKPRAKPKAKPRQAQKPARKTPPKRQTAVPKKRKSALATTGQDGRNSAGDGKAVSAAASKRAMARYGRTVNRHVARRKPAGGGKGTVALTVRIGRSGKLVGASVARGSGNAALDKAALAAVRRAAPYPAPPAGVPGKVIAVRISLRFR